MPIVRLLLLRGLLALLFGIAAFAWPGGMTLSVLVLLFGLFLLVDGLFMLGEARYWPSA